MKLWLICAGAPAMTWPGRCTGEEFDALCREEALCGIVPKAGRAVRANGRRLYISPWRSARETADLLVQGAEPEVEPLLEEIPRRAFRAGGRRMPLWLWRLMARLQRRLGSRRQPESPRESARRADALLDKLEARGEDCILIAHPAFLAVLLDRLRLRGYVAQRTGFGPIRPLEHMLLSRREEHCGGCQHNCLLSNPGCNIGRDKAARHSG